MTFSEGLPVAYPEIEQFLKDHEYTCASLTDCFIRHRSDTVLYVFRKEGVIRGIFSLSKAGVVLSCLPYQEDYEEYRPLLKRFFYGHRLFCVNGEEKSTSFVVTALSEAGEGVPVQVNNYIMMLLRCGTAAHAPAMPSCSIVRCSEEDADMLQPLETGYQREEVLPDGQEFDPVLCRRSLHTALRCRTVFAVELKDPAGRHFIAKAGTNADCYRCSQIGGVYTLPAYRRRGYALQAVAAVVSDMAVQHKDCVLFVNEKNYGAYALYEKIGFSAEGRYIIAYY